jgi:RNA polymerase sigma factor (TIGR02999 family)
MIDPVPSAPETAQPAAVDALFATLYDDLRGLAHARLRRSTPMTSLDTTGLVHESYLRFLKSGNLNAQDQRQFLAYASRVMRSIVVDIVRSHMAEKHGGEIKKITLNTEIGDSVAHDEGEVIRINDALSELATIEPRLVQVVEMRYFAGLSEKEVADALGVTTRTIARDWEKAKFFLAHALK